MISCIKGTADSIVGTRNLRTFSSLLGNEGSRLRECVIVNVGQALLGRIFPGKVAWFFSHNFSIVAYAALRLLPCVDDMWK